MHLHRNSSSGLYTARCRRCASCLEQMTCSAMTQTCSGKGNTTRFESREGISVLTEILLSVPESSRPIRAIYSGESKELVNPAFIEHFAALSTTSDAPIDASVNVWDSVRGSGIAPLLFKKCEESKVPFAALLMACAEGDNVPDAVAMASHVVTYLQLVPAPEASAQPPRVPFVFPPSWSQLFGRGPDVSLYL